MIIGMKQRWQHWFARRFPPRDGATTIANGKVYILPTRFGWGFVLALLVLVLIGINYSNNLIYGLAFWLAGIALVALVQTQRQLPGLSLRVKPPTPVFAGEPLQLEIEAVAPEKRAAWGLAISLAWPNQAAPMNPKGSDKDGPENKRYFIDAGQQQTLLLSLATERRGRFTVPLLRVAANYPLGLFQAWSFIHQPRETVVYPKPAGQAALPPAKPQPQGADAASTQPGSDEYDGLRRYRTGDPMRHIAWKSVAQKASTRADGKPLASDFLSKAFHAEAAEMRQFDLPSALRIAGDREAALSLLCRWVLDARNSGLAYELVIDAGEGADSKHESGADNELAALALYGERSNLAGSHV